ncbi:MerR family transcriptional regulator [Prevotella amnii]|jgi:hypothetical protein|nr:hypothetical protein [Prevotella amnii]
MSNSIKNTLIGVFLTVAIAFFGAWVQINSRISMLEVQVNDDHVMFQRQTDKYETNMKELMNKVNDIQNKVTELGAKQEVKNEF